MTDSEPKKSDVQFKTETDMYHGGEFRGDTVSCQIVLVTMNDLYSRAFYASIANIRSQIKESQRP